MTELQLADFPFESRATFKNIHDLNLKVGFFDLNDRCLFASEAMEALFGSRNQSVAGSSIVDIFAEHTRAAFTAAKQRLLDHHYLPASYVDVALKKKSGDIENHHFVLCLVRGDDGEARYFRGIFYDELDEVSFQRSLVGSSADNLLNLANVIFSTVDKNGFFTKCEGRLSKHVVLNFIGKHFSEVYWDRPEAQLRIRRALGGESFEVEISAGGLWYHIWYEPLMDANAQIIGAGWTCCPIDKQKHLETQLKKSLAKESETVRLREDLLSMASHEIKNPLTSLSIQFQSIERFVNSDADMSLIRNKALQIAESGQRQIERISELAENFLDASSLQSTGLVLKKKQADLALVLKDVAQKYHVQSKRAGCDIQVDSLESVIGFFDLCRLEQVIENLISNAIKYAAGFPICVSLNVHENRAVLRVKDHGHGISTEDQKKIFERFARSDQHKNIKGFGIGLYIVKQIVEAHGGSIQVSSETNKGTVFLVEIPLTAP